MKIIVTGSLGHISLPLTTELVEQGHAVTVISHQPDRRPAIEALGATAAIGSLEDAPFLAATFAGADAVYCMLPPFDIFDPALDFLAVARKLATNYVGAIRQAGVPRVVQLSSIGADLTEGSGGLLFHHLAEAIFRELPADVALTQVRPGNFYTNLYQHLASIKDQGVIVGSYGGDDQIVWVSPRDIAAAVAEELTTPAAGRHVRYVASDELTCNQVARILGEAVGQPQLQWTLISDQAMLSGFEQFNIPTPIAKALVEMNASIHSGRADADYYRHRPPVLGKVKITDFAQEFAAVYNQPELTEKSYLVPPA